MMKNEFLLSHLNHAQIEVWLAAALKGDRSLPRIMPDEPHYLAIMRLELMQESQVRRSLNLACISLLRGFCAQAQGEPEYIKQLLALTAEMKIPESIPMLVALTARFKDMPELEFDIRNAVLSVLNMGSPPQSYEFWHELLMQDRARYAARAISGALSWDKFQAVQMLPDMPDIGRTGSATMLKLDLAWDDLPATMRQPFVLAVQAILPRCGAVFAEPIAAWVQTKIPASNTASVVLMAVKTSIQDKLILVLGYKEAAANATSPSLKASSPSPAYA
jgi:hypothetical protein